MNNILTRPPQQKPREHITGPEDAMQFDLVPEKLPASSGYQKLCCNHGRVLQKFPGLPYKEPKF